jgi:endonuclease/exonuclease/phosphatase family metal-dependent hydrolase
MDRLRVLTLNIWNRQGPWEERLAMIRRGLQWLKPDLVGLQEVISHDGETQADAIADGLEYHTAFGSAVDLSGGVLFGNAVLSRFPIVDHETWPLPVRAGQETRSLLRATVESPWGPLPFFSTHLNWMFHHGVVREAQVVEIAKRVSESAPVKGLPPVLVGDFNAEPTSAEVRFLCGLQSLTEQSTYFADAYGLVGDPPGVTFDSGQNPYAALTHEAPRRIDYVFVRGPDHRGRGKPVAARVVLREVIEGVAASDHFGVLAEINMAG